MLFKCQLIGLSKEDKGYLELEFGSCSKEDKG